MPPYRTSSRAAACNLFLSCVGMSAVLAIFTLSVQHRISTQSSSSILPRESPLSDRRFLYPQSIDLAASRYHDVRAVNFQCGPDLVSADFPVAKHHVRANNDPTYARKATDTQTANKLARLLASLTAVLLGNPERLTAIGRCRILRENTFIVRVIKSHGFQLP